MIYTVLSGILNSTHSLTDYLSQYLKSCEQILVGFSGGVGLGFGHSWISFHW